jgi:hypothetical protein
LLALDLLNKTKNTMRIGLSWTGAQEISITSGNNSFFPYLNTQGTASSGVVNLLLRGCSRGTADNALLISIGQDGNKVFLFTWFSCGVD